MAVGDKMDGSTICERIMSQRQSMYSWTHDEVEWFGKYLYHESPGIVILREVGTVKIWRVSESLLTERIWTNGID